MKKITGVLVNPDRKVAGIVALADRLEAYYAALDCTCIDIVTRRIGGRPFCIVCDDEGLLRSDPQVSALDARGRPMLVGRLFVVQDGGEGDLRSLTDEEAAHVLLHILTLDARPLLYPCEY